MPKPCVVDTNVIVSGLIGRGGPPTQIVDAMLDGDLLYALSADLFDEYASVLRRPSIVRLHGRTDDELDVLLEEIAANAVWRNAAAAVKAPDPDDSHIWALLAELDGGLLVTGDRLLRANPPEGNSVLSPRDFVDALMKESSPAEPGRET